MIYVNITGGLGNQLFQYAFARRIQKDTGERICLNIYELEKYDNKRSFCLDKYKLINNTIVSRTKLPWYVHRRSICSKLLRRISPQMFYLFGKLKNSYIWYQSYRNEIFPVSSKKDIYIGGYWQDPIYSMPAIGEIRKDLEINEKLSEHIYELVQEINANISVCVHIRRGDYIGSPYEVCTKEYYLNAINEVKKSDPNAIFYIFSDDPQWVKNNMPDEQCIRIQENNEAYIDLFVMSKCKHFIISNSTFSWWAQYLGNYDKKKVYAPQIWHKEYDCNNLYLCNWIVI
jgi:hypothetical protein